MKYIIDGELKDSLIGLIILIQTATNEDEYLELSNGEIYKFPYLDNLKYDLYNLKEY